MLSREQSLGNDVHGQEECDFYANMNIKSILMKS